MPRTRRFLPGLAIAVLASAASVPSTAGAQSPTPRAGVPAAPRSPEPAARGWRVRPLVSAEGEYDDNVFLLRPSRQDNLAVPSGQSLASGRYANMESASDVVTTMRAEASLEGRGLSGKKLSITPKLAYELHALNAERRNVTLSLDVEQALRRGSRAGFRARIQPSYFGRNYLLDATDRDGSGTIDPSERLYQGGFYSERELSLDYLFRLNKSTRRSPFGAEVELEGGYYGRTYEAPFAGRDLSGPTAAATLLLALNRRLSLDVGFQFAALAATPSIQVLLLDEQDFDRDFNGNGSTTDLDVRAREMVDRSRRQVGFDAKARFEFSRRAGLKVGYARRSRTFTSEQPFDVSYRGRSDARDELEAGVGVRLTRQLRLVGSGSMSRQRLNRESDRGAVGEIADYDRLRTRIALAYHF